jgi:hypothetical protein
MDKQFNDMMDKIKGKTQTPMPLSVTEALAKVVATFKEMKELLATEGKPLGYGLYVETAKGKLPGVCIFVREEDSEMPDPEKVKSLVQILGNEDEVFDVVTVALKINSDPDTQPINTHYRAAKEVSEKVRLRAVSYGMIMKDMAELPADIIQFLLEDVLPKGEENHGNAPSPE